MGVVDVGSKSSKWFGWQVEKEVQRRGASKQKLWPPLAGGSVQWAVEAHVVYIFNAAWAIKLLAVWAEALRPLPALKPAFLFFSPVRASAQLRKWLPPSHAVHLSQVGRCAIAVSRQPAATHLAEIVLQPGAAVLRCGVCYKLQVALQSCCFNLMWAEGLRLHGVKLDAYRLQACC